MCPLYPHTRFKMLILLVSSCDLGLNLSTQEAEAGVLPQIQDQLEVPEEF